LAEAGTLYATDPALRVVRIGVNLMFRLIVSLGAVVAVLAIGAQPAEATWSVVAVDPRTGEVGVAVASCVGSEVSIVPVLVPGVGAAASQARISPPSGARIVKALSAGATAEETINVVVSVDDAPDDRQFGVVVFDRGGAGWTGTNTFDVAVDRRSTNGTVSAQGNILVSEDVIDAAIAAFNAAAGELPDRLLAALVAGADEGGDSRCGDQTARSAALIVARPGDETYSFTDAGVLGVDPTKSTVPSIFISVLVPEGGDRAPDRLFEAWAGADHDAPTVVIRQIDSGAGTAIQRVTTIALVLVGLAIVVGVVVLVAVVRSRRGHSAT
jgi:uncharacterized Ntn-hydrolase superfamily protein